MRRRAHGRLLRRYDSVADQTSRHATSHVSPSRRPRPGPGADRRCVGLRPLARSLRTCPARFAPCSSAVDTAADPRVPWMSIADPVSPDSSVSRREFTRWIRSVARAVLERATCPDQHHARSSRQDRQQTWRYERSGSCCLHQRDPNPLAYRRARAPAPLTGLYLGATPKRINDFR